MKKMMLSFALAVAGYAAMAQDYSKVNLYYAQKKYEDAKKELDKIAASDKGKDKAETFLWQSALYSEFYKDSTLASKYPDAATQGYTALMTYKQKDPTLKSLKETGALNSIANLYTTSFEYGKRYFAGSKWPEAFNSFKLATDMSEFINENGFSSTQSKLDTFTVLYTGYAAQNAGKPEEAVRYYERLADAKAAGPEMQPMYQYLLDDYSKMKQTDKFNKYLAVAKELYPDKTDLWSQLEMSNMTGNSSLTQIVDKYNADAKGTMTEDQLVNYAQTFAAPEKDQLTGMDSAQQVQLKLTAADAFKKAFAINPKGLYAYNAGVLNYQVFNVLDDRFYTLRGESAALKTQRADVQKQQQVYADTSIAWLEKSYEILKAKNDRDKSETTSLNRAVDNLANLYMWKRERAKGIAPKDYDKYDAKYNQYADEHDKYKAM